MNHQRTTFFISNAVLVACLMPVARHDCSSFPQAMQIAILSGWYLVRVHFEDSLRCISGVKKLPVYFTVVGNCFNPLIIVYLSVGMGHTADLYLKAALYLVAHRDVLF